MDQLTAVLSIVLIDLVLSGDNAVVIGLAAHRLPPRQRRLAILAGGAAAIVLRIALTAVASLLLVQPGLKAVGGLLLLAIAFRLLKEEEESAEGTRQAGSLREAVVTIVIADFIMSLDNILGVAAAAGGDVPLLIFGLLFSMAILMVGGSVVAALMNRLAWLTYVGAAVISWTGAEMALRDPLVVPLLPLSDAARNGIAALLTAATVALAHYVHRHRPRQRRARSRADRAGHHAEADVAGAAGRGRH